MFFHSFLLHFIIMGFFLLTCRPRSKTLKSQLSSVDTVPVTSSPLPAFSHKSHPFPSRVFPSRVAASPHLRRGPSTGRPPPTATPARTLGGCLPHWTRPASLSRLPPPSACGCHLDAAAFPPIPRPTASPRSARDVLSLLRFLADIWC